MSTHFEALTIYMRVKISENLIFMVKPIKMMVFRIYLNKYKKFQEITPTKVVDLIKIYTNR